MSEEYAKACTGALSRPETPSYWGPLPLPRPAIIRSWCLCLRLSAASVGTSLSSAAWCVGGRSSLHVSAQTSTLHGLLEETCGRGGVGRGVHATRCRLQRYLKDEAPTRPPKQTQRNAAHLLRCGQTQMTEQDFGFAFLKEGIEGHKPCEQRRMAGFARSSSRSRRAAVLPPFLHHHYLKPQCWCVVCCVSYVGGGVRVCLCGCTQSRQ